MTTGPTHVDDLEALDDHGVRYRPVRHHFGISSFGTVAWVGEAAGDLVVPPFDEGSAPAEELFVVLAGRATFDLDGETVDAPVGTLVHAAPGTPRSAVAAEPGTTVLAVDGRPGEAYDATGWEVWAPLVPLYDAGEWDELADRLEAVTADHPQYPMLVYNLACAEALGGRTDAAIDHVRQAIEASARFRDDARDDDDLDALRADPRFQALLAD